MLTEQKYYITQIEVGNIRSMSQVIMSDFGFIILHPALRCINHHKLGDRKYRHSGATLAEWIPLKLAVDIEPLPNQ